MLRILLYGMIDAEVKYGCTEMLEHLGLPYVVVDDLRDLKATSRASDVLLIPESSIIEDKEAKAIIESKCSVLLTGSVPEKLWQYSGCRTEAIRGKPPPETSGLLRIDKIGIVPFFYEFKILTCNNKTSENIAFVEDEQGEQLGASIFELNGRCLAVSVPQIFRSATYLLAGGEATLPFEDQGRLSLIDKYGRIDGRKTEIFRKGFSRTPVVNVYEKFLFQLFLKFSKKMGMPLVCKWFYPGNYDMALCLTHEAEYALSPATALDAVHSFKDRAFKEGLAEGFLALIAIFSSVLCKLRISERRNSLGLLPRFIRTRLMRFNPIWNFGEFVDVEKRFGATSSFYFLMNRTGMDSDYDFENPLIKAVMTSLRKNGWDVGLHASFCSYKNSDILKEEKLALENALREKVVGVRHHFSRISIPITWKCQEKAGFLYDATAGYAQEVGFATGSCLPFTPWDCRSKKPIAILEIPLAVIDGTLFQKHYLALSPAEAWGLCKRLVDVVHEHCGTLTLDWHSSLDRKRHRPWFRLYEKILAYSSTYKPWYTNGKDLAEWWNLRKSIFLEDGKDDNVTIRFHINSPSQCYLLLGAFIPIDHENMELSVNGRRIDEKAIVKKGEMLLIPFNISEGRTAVDIQLQS